MRRRAPALAAARGEMLAFCRGLADDEWSKPSAAPGWSVLDVIAHLGSGAHALFTPASLTLLRSKDIERTNDDLVAARSAWSPEWVIREYEVWSGRVLPLAKAADATPLRGVRVPLAELGRFPVGLLLAGALTFDHHTHLRHDLAPALGRSVPDPDPVQMAVTLEWMLAVLGNQIRAGDVPALCGPVGLELTGPGGGAWTLTPAGVRKGLQGVRTTVTATAPSFPDWGTRRSGWREHGLEIDGNTAAAEALLDQINVV